MIDTNLNAVLKRLKENGLTLNAKKCEFNTEKIFFFGHIFSRNGLSADPAKVTAIQNCSAPSNVEEVRSLLGMTNYVSRFIKDYSTITEPIRTLTNNLVILVQWKKIVTSTVVANILLSRTKPCLYIRF